MIKTYPIVLLALLVPFAAAGPGVAQAGSPGEEDEEKVEIVIGMTAAWTWLDQLSSWPKDWDCDREVAHSFPPQLSVRCHPPGTPTCSDPVVGAEYLGALNGLAGRSKCQADGQETFAYCQTSTNVQDPLVAACSEKTTGSVPAETVLCTAFPNLLSYTAPYAEVRCQYTLTPASV